jgi:tetratricopeptide (TPR) repeat protein
MPDGEAISELERAVEFDPLVSWTQIDLGSALNHARRPDQARALLSGVIEHGPMLPHAHRILGLALVQLGEHEEAVAAFRRTVELTGGEAFATAYLGWACGVAGRMEEARELLGQLLALTARACRSAGDRLAPPRPGRHRRRVLLAGARVRGQVELADLSQGPPDLRASAFGPEISRSAAATAPSGVVLAAQACPGLHRRCDRRIRLRGRDGSL